jgi:hypothetical protein
VHVETFTAGRFATMVLLPVVGGVTDHRSCLCRTRPEGRLRSGCRRASSPEQSRNRQQQEGFGSVNPMLAREKPMEPFCHDRLQSNADAHVSFG